MVRAHAEMCIDGAILIMYISILGRRVSMGDHTGYEASSDNNSRNTKGENLSIHKSVHKNMEIVYVFSRKKANDFFH